MAQRWLIAACLLLAPALAVDTAPAFNCVTSSACTDPARPVKCFADFLFLGVHKCGTTSLLAMLLRHPDLAVYHELEPAARRSSPPKSLALSKALDEEDTWLLRDGITRDQAHEDEYLAPVQCSPVLASDVINGSLSEAPTPQPLPRMPTAITERLGDAGRQALRAMSRGARGKVFRDAIFRHLVEDRWIPIEKAERYGVRLSEDPNPDGSDPGAPRFAEAQATALGAMHDLEDLLAEHPPSSTTANDGAISADRRARLGHFKPGFYFEASRNIALVSSFFPPSIKFIFLLRDPTAARHSFFWYVRRSTTQRWFDKQAARPTASLTSAQPSGESSGEFDEWAQSQLNRSTAFSACILATTSVPAEAPLGVEECGQAKFHHALAAFMYHLPLRQWLRAFPPQHGNASRFYVLSLEELLEAPAEVHFSTQPDQQTGLAARQCAPLSACSACDCLPAFVSLSRPIC